ncbi:retrovirus-related pol polyprotein from transposon TNT 1-94 [Tanacetum coccineum]
MTLNTGCYNYDQWYAYLIQRERHANEVRIMHERYLNPLALVANSQTIYNPSQSPQHSGSSMYLPPQQFTSVYAAPIHHQHHHTPVNPQQQSISLQPFISPLVIQLAQAEFPQLGSGLSVPIFQQGEDPIDCINKAIAFLSLVALTFPPSNNQLRTSSSPRNQETIQDGRVTVQQVQGRQTQSFAGTRNQRIATTSRGNYAAGQAKITIPQNSVFQTKDLDAYDSDCDDISLAKAVLMANLSSCDSDVLSKESQNAGIHDTNSFAPNGLLVLSLVEQMTDHVANLDKENQTNKMEHDVISVIDDEETLILEEESQSKMLDKPNDPISIKQKLIFLPLIIQQQAFWLKHSNYNPDTYVKSHKPIRIEAPSELPKVSLVNESLKKLKYQLANFDKVVKKRTTSDAIMADEITEVQTVFNQMEAVVDQCSSQEKDTVIRKLKDRIKSLSGKDSVENAKKDIDEIETINIELEHTLKNELRKLIGKNVVDTAVSKPSATIAPEMFKLDTEPISHRLKNNRDAHEVYLEKTIENTDTIRRLVECTRKQNPSEPLLESACIFTKHVVQIVLWYLDSGCSEHMTRNRSQLIVFVSKFLGTIKFGNDHIAKIMGYRDYQMGNFTISQVIIKDLGKLKPKADIGIFVGYAHAKKAFRIYNKRNQMIIEIIHVDFDELTTMASEQISLGPGPKLMTTGTISSGLVPNIPSSTLYVPPTKNDWEILFQPMFDEYLLSRAILSA